MFIVLEGLDGAGKSTQIQKLRTFIEGQGLEVEYIHFPRFDSPVFGDMIARFLRGEFGGVDDVDPYIVALLFAGDRHNASKTIRGWIESGKVVILDRYVYSNIGFQCAKLSSSDDQQRLKDWILELEFGYFGIPRPDVSLFLDVPFSFTERKLSEQREGDDRSYLKGAADIHESSLDLQQSVRRVYLDAAKCDSSLKIVDCSDDRGGIETPESIFDRILIEVRPLLGK